MPGNDDNATAAPQRIRGRGRGGKRRCGRGHKPHRSQHQQQRPSGGEGVSGVREQLVDSEAASHIKVPNAFEKSFPAVSRVREVGRKFTVGGHTFAVMERTIAGMDDTIYKKHRDVWEHLSRGNVRVFHINTHDPEATTLYTPVASVNGLRKFGYSDSNYGDEDKVTHVIAIEKENGECGHIGAFSLSSADGHRVEKYWVVGSKNVHIVLRYDIPEDDFAVYSGMRYGYALKIARLWKETCARSMAAEQIAEFHSALQEHKWTACFESISADSQHLVDYRGANELRFYAITEAGVSSEKGVCVDVLSAKAFYEKVGLYFSKHSAMTPMPSKEYDALIDDIARRGNSEGCVMYGCDSSTGAVMRLWKEKSYPYVMERATREAITTNKLAGKELRARLAKKLAMQQAQLRQFFSEWERDRMPWLIDFGAWLQITEVLTPGQSQSEISAVRNRWLSLQAEFTCSITEDPEILEVCRRYEPDPVNWGDATQLDVVKFVGPQGCGKSTISRILFVLLTQVAGQRPRWVNQDEAGNRKNFLSWIRQASNVDSGVTHLMIDKMNLDARMNSDYEKLPITVTVAFEHSGGETAMFEECYGRIIARAARHRTIRLADSLTSEEREEEMKNIRRFVSQAVHTCEIPDDSTTLVLDVTGDLTQMVKAIWERLQISGVHALPDVTTAQIETAYALSRRYEELLVSVPKPPVYSCIRIQDPAALVKLVPPAFLHDHVVQAQFHITTKYFLGDTDPIYFVELSELLAKEIEVTLLRVVADDKGCAIVVRREANEFPCANPIAHITVSNRKGIPPKYSNELCAEEAASSGARPQQRKVHELPPHTMLKGVFEFR